MHNLDGPIVLLKWLLSFTTMASDLNSKIADPNRYPCFFPALQLLVKPLSCIRPED